MPVRNAAAEWEGNLKNGQGRMELASGAFKVFGKTVNFGEPILT